MIHSNWLRVILNEANAENVVESDLNGLEALAHSCIRGSVGELSGFLNDARPHVRGAASFIMRRHRFESAKLEDNENWGVGA